MKAKKRDDVHDPHLKAITRAATENMFEVATKAFAENG
jgi:hypothetical protein